MKSTNHPNKIFLLASTAAALAISTTAPASGTPHLSLNTIEIAGLPTNVTIAADKLGHMIAFYDNDVDIAKAEIFSPYIDGQATYMQQIGFSVDGTGELTLTIDDTGDTMELALKTTDLAKALKSADLGDEIGLEPRLKNGQVSTLMPTRSAASTTKVYFVKMGPVDFAFWDYHGKQQMAQVTGDKRHGYQIIGSIVEVMVEGELEAA